MNATPTTQAAPPEGTAGRSKLRWTIFGLVFLAILAIPFILFADRLEEIPDEVQDWAGDNKGLVVLIVLVGLSADVFVPVPNALTNAFAGSVLGWGPATLVVWIGLTIGSLLGYGFGRSAGRPLARKVVGEGDLRSAENRFSDIGITTVILTRPIPAVAEMVSLAAGLAKMNFRSFAIATFVSNLGVAAIFAGVGASSIHGRTAFIASIAAALIPTATWIVMERRRSRSSAA